MSQFLLPSIFALAALCGLIACTYEPYEQGHQLYVRHCSSCHMEDGTGLEQLIPSLRQNRFLLQSEAELACLIRLGAKDSLQINGKWLYGDMPPNDKLNATEITNILNYLRHAWGNEASVIKAQEVEEALENCLPKGR